MSGVRVAVEKPAYDVAARKYIIDLLSRQSLKEDLVVSDAKVPATHLIPIPKIPKPPLKDSMSAIQSLLTLDLTENQRFLHELKRDETQANPARVQDLKARIAASKKKMRMQIDYLVSLIMAEQPLDTLFEERYGILSQASLMYVLAEYHNNLQACIAELKPEDLAQVTDVAKDRKSVAIQGTTDLDYVELMKGSGSQWLWHQPDPDDVAREAAPVAAAAASSAPRPASK